MPPSDHTDLPPTLADIARNVPHVSLDELVNHPRLAEARKVYLDHFLAVYSGDPFLVRLLIESGRILIFVIVLLLDAGQDPARRETWLTIGRLKREMARFGLASERQIDTLVRRFSEVGYLSFRPAEQDRRVRLLKPTEAMLAHDRDWLAAHYVPLALLCPENDYGPVLRRDPAIQMAQRRAGMALLPLSAQLFTTFPDMLLFLNRAGGFPVIAALLQAAMADPTAPHAAVPFGDVGDRFGISRTQVRNLLIAAEEMGLVKLHMRGGQRVEILPRLWTSHDRGMAVGMYLHDLAYGLATGRRSENFSLTAATNASACSSARAASSALTGSPV